MRQIEIEAYADMSQPDQGRVALLLHGVTALPRSPVMRLRPVDPAMLAEDEGQWPEGDVLPAEARILDDGVELIIGADVAESPALLPGTAVEIEFPELRLRGEVLWPSIALAARPRRRSIVGKRAPAAARPASPVVRESPVVRGRDRSPGRAADRGGSPLAAPAHATADNIVTPAQQLPDFLRPDSLRKDIGRPDAARGDIAATAQPNRSPQQTRPAQRAATLVPAQPEPGPGQSARHLAEDRPQDVAGSGNAASVAGRIAWTPERGQPEKGPAEAMSGDNGLISQPRAAVTDAGVPQTVRPLPAASAWGPRARVFGLVIGTVLAIEAMLFAAKGYLPMSAGADIMAGKVTRATAAAGSSDLRLNDVVHAGAVSPRGVAVQENNPDKLLALANASLHAPGAARDVEEGAYWLKRYIAASLGEERMLRALTQLGSAYAEPASGKPDFARARQLWEFASAFGDPVAMCFLGALHEHGLGVAAEKKAALHWYARAKSAGGCPQLEESIARVMP